MKDCGMSTIRSLVGEVTERDLRFVDCFISSKVSLFIPAVGPCFYSVTPDHCHPAYSFVLTFDAYARISAQGNMIHSQPGQVMAIDPGSVHHEIIEDECPRYIAIFISRDFFEQELARYPNLKPCPFDFRTFTPGREFTGLLKEFMNEFESHLPASETILAAIGVRITHYLIRAAYGISATPTRIGNRLEIHRTIEYLQTHPSEKISVAKLAGIATMSPSHFSRVFKLETGVSPLTYLIRVRLKRAKKLLRAGGYSITEIAISCGFSTPSHFTDSFSRYFGRSPSDYLKFLSSSSIPTKKGRILKAE